MTVGSKVNQTLATLRGVKNTLKVYSINDQNQESRIAYAEAVEVTDNIIKDLENQIGVLEIKEPQYKQK